MDVKFFEVPTPQTDKSDFYMNHTLETLELVNWNSSSAPDGNTGLLLDEAKMQAIINRLSRPAASLGVVLRPHLKSTKSIEIARRVLTGEPASA